MGSIRKRGENYVADWSVDGARKRKTFKLQREAREWLSRVDVSMAEGTYIDPARFKKNTLQILIDKYTEALKDDPKQRAFNTSKVYHIEKIKEFFGADRLIMTIRKPDLQAFRVHLERLENQHGRKYTVASVNRMMSCLSHMMNWAEKMELIPHSPFKAAGAGEITRKPENNQLDRYLDSAEIARLVAACKGHLRDMVIAAINSGMRFSEIRTLKWSQVRGGFVYLTHTKSGKPRQIPINVELDALFKRLRPKPGDFKTEYVFTFQGQPISDNVDNAMKSACKRAGLKYGRPDGVTFHILRHTFASHVAAKTGNIKLVKELLGHSELKTTERYTHLAESAFRSAVDSLNGLTSQSAPASQTVSNGAISVFK